MSTFFHTDNSPLLSQNQFTPQYQNNLAEQYELYKQQMMNQYMNQNPQQPQPQNRDFLSELDSLTKGLDKETLRKLTQDVRYTELNAKLQSCIQEEIMNMVKAKINSNSAMTENIKEEIEIINRLRNEVKEEERNNYYEMQDYLKNYSNMTFDDYRRLKNKNKQQENEIIEMKGE